MNFFADFALTPVFASGAIQFAFEKATLEGKLTIGSLLILSFFSWTIIMTKSYQLYKARKMGRKFFAASSETRDPLVLHRRGDKFEGAPVYQLYKAGAEELDYHLKKDPIEINGTKRISNHSFEAVKVSIQEAAIVEAIGLEKGMIILSTAVSGGPFIGLLGTVWGVMETFAGVAKANSASLTAMAPGVAGALIATVVGLLVAIPAMFAYNFMVTTIRSITQELDAFGARFVTQMEHAYGDTRPLSEELKEANEALVTRITESMRANQAYGRVSVTTD